MSITVLSAWTGVNSSSVASTSVTPAANSLVIAIAVCGNGDNDSITAESLTDSLGQTWTPLAGPKYTTSSSAGGIWVKDAGASPAAQTITAKFTGSLGSSGLVVLQGTSTAPAASQTGAVVAQSYPAGTGGFTQSVTPTTTGSLVVGAFGTSTGTFTLTANAATSIYGQFRGSIGDTIAAFSASAASTGGTAENLGFTNVAGVSSVWVAAEILLASFSGAPSTGVHIATSVTGSKRASGSVTATVHLATSVTGTPVGTVSTGPHFGSSAAGAKLDSGTVTAALHTATSIAGAKQASGSVASSTHLDHSVAGAKQESAAPSAGVHIATAATGAKRASGAVTAALAIGASATGSQGGTVVGSVRFTSSATGAKRVTGAATTGPRILPSMVTATPSTRSGLLPSALPTAFGNPMRPPGTPNGPGGTGGVAAPSPGAGWEIRVKSHTDYTTTLAVLPWSLFTSLQFAKILKDKGAGTVTLNMDDPWWAEVTLGDGSPTEDLLDFENLWQAYEDGALRFEWLGETVTEQLTDQAESRQVTVSGPGTIAMLGWQATMPPGFPHIVFKLDAIQDGFAEINQQGNTQLDTSIWNAASPSADITLNPLGTAQITATPGTTFLGATTYDATNTLVSAQVTPINNGSSTGLDGSQVTQFYVQSLRNPAYYAMIGLSAGAFYCQLGGPAGTFTKQLGTYDPQQHTHWQISEQLLENGNGDPHGSGTFYFWTSLDGTIWTKQWQIQHNWDATQVGLYITAKYDVASSVFASVTSINGNVITPSSAGNTYIQQPIMSVWLDNFNRAKARGTAPWLTTALTAAADSFGNPWADSNSVQIQNGTDLYSLLQSHTAIVNADWIMQPGMLLQVGIPEPGKITLGTDRSQQIVLREGGQLQTRQRVRARDQIANLIGAVNSDGHVVSASSGSSISQWGQREGWITTAVQVDPLSMQIAAAASVQETGGEVLSWTVSIDPDAPAGNGRPFKDYDVGDWLGQERPDFSAIDAVRVAGIAVNVDSQGLYTAELTMVSYVQWLQEQLKYLVDKMGGQFINSLGTTPVTSNSASPSQLPTVFAPSLGMLADVTTVSGGTVPAGTPLVYNPNTGQWQPAGTADPVSGAPTATSVSGPGGSVTLTGGTGSSAAGVTVSSPTPQPADGGAPAPPGSSVSTTPAGHTITDGTGTVRIITGEQLDGTVTTKVLNAPPPAAPDTPSVSGGILGLIVGWDGQLGGHAPVSDFLYTEVHCSTTPAFTPAPATLQGHMPAGGLFGIGGLTAGTTYYVALVGVNQAGARSVPSVEEPGVPTSVPANIGPGSIAGTAIQTGTITATQISASAGILGSQLSATAGISQGQVAFTARQIGGITTTVGGTQPSSPAAGDLWFNSANGFQLYQYSGTAWNLYQFGTGAIAANSVTAALIAANTITAAQIATGTITATQISASTITGDKIAGGTITATNIQSGTVTAGLLAAGIVVAGIIDGTVVTGSTLQNSGSNPRTSINPDGSISITNPAGTVIFKIDATGTMFWYTGAGNLLMELQPGGSTLIYQQPTGPQGWPATGQWSFADDATDGWIGTNSSLSVSSTGDSDGDGWALQVTASGSGSSWYASSPLVPGVTPNALVSLSATVETPAALTAVGVNIDWFNSSGGYVSTTGGATSATTAGGTLTVSVSGPAPGGATQFRATVIDVAPVSSGAVMNADAISWTMWAGFSGVAATLSQSTNFTWAGLSSLLVTASGATQPWGVLGPQFPAAFGQTYSAQVVVDATQALAGVSVGFIWYNSSGTQVGTSAGDQGAVAMTTGQTVMFTVTGASPPAGTDHGKITVTDTDTTAGFSFAVGQTSIPGGLVYSNSPVEGVDSFGTPYPEGVSFVGLPGQANILGVESPFGQQLAAIDGAGNVQGQTISAATDLVVAGQSMLGAIIPGLPAGNIVRGNVPAASLNYPPGPSGLPSVSEAAVFYVSASVVAGRSYRVILENCRVVMSSGAGTSCYARLHGTIDGTVPTTGSDILGADFCWTSANGAATPKIIATYRATTTGTLNVALGLATSAGTAQLSAFNASPGAFAGVMDGLSVEDIGLNVNTVNSWIPMAGGVGGGTFTVTVYPVNTWSYSQTGSQRNKNGSLYQGQNPKGDGYGSQYCYMDFSSLLTTIPAGATINWATLRLQNQASALASGVSVVTHYSTVLGSLGATQLSAVIDTVAFSEGQMLAFSTALAAGMYAAGAKYVVLRAPSGSVSSSYYGYFTGGNPGIGHTSTIPQLQVNYTA